MRDALSILERCVQDGDNKIDENKIRDLVGIPSISLVHDVIDSVFSYDIDKTLEAVDVILNEGKDIVNLLWEMIKYCKDILVYKTAGKLEMYNEEEKNQIKNIADKVTKEQLINMIYELSEMENDIKRTTQKTIMFQAGMIRLCQPKVVGENINQSNLVSNIPQNTQNYSSNLEARVEKIENYLTNNKNVGQEVNQGNMQGVNTVPQQDFTSVNVAKNVAGENASSNLNNLGNSGDLSNTVKQDKTKSKPNNITTTMKFSKNSEEYWPQILDDLKQRGKRVLYTNLMGTRAKEINDMTVGIEFPNGMTSFGKLVLDKQENMREISNLLSMACGKEMQIKYIVPEQNTHKVTREENLQNLANESDIPFNIIE